MIYFSGVGTLQNDPELRHVGKDMTVCKFTLYTTKKVKGEVKSSYFDCEVWGRPAEVLAEYKKKGDLLQVNGLLDQDTWEKDGQKRSKIVLKVNDIQFVFTGNKEKAPSTKKASVTVPDDSSEGFDEVPF